MKMHGFLCFSFSRIFSRKGSRSSSSNNSSDAKSRMSNSDQDSQVKSGGTDASARHRFDEQGRRYHNRPDAAYMLPNDDEEIDRVHMQHWVIKIAFQGNFHAPVEQQLEDGIVVLDGGCGPGTWSLEMAENFPRSKFYGVDISGVFPSEIKPANCDFQVHNVSQPLPFAPSYFDYVFQRMLVLGIMREEWDTVLSNYMEVLKPGGWLELTEVNIPDSVNAGPKLTILMETLGEVAAQKGLQPGVSSELGKKLKKAGAINIHCRRIEVPMHHDGKLGSLLWEDFVTAFRGLIKPFVTKKHPELEDDAVYLKFVEDAGKECEEYQNYIIFYRAFGQKPTTST
ncbi:S-adenosyl-L-methionine-dependent methyltransferase [Zychaea mexicana]|uniref:S-adenosyl-L-methionine-dependent methyltransferase n=1 Tax=Zychaea mexicana TaxID=64656 RepID=UPI0022FEE7EF|nr:S-adenosyl-L-methionine-dependent methyltransferase [Zychaea mexicana]KAI9496766.1 S-adenosyl-L-methionine-dependent methyltransferase [Zychaea mexicana]